MATRLRRCRNFNPRSPRGERRALSRGDKRTACISIHAPREGSDVFSGTRFNIKTNFNPRSPRGERRCWGELRLSRKEFQSTLPARGATHQHQENRKDCLFQSTLPARGATIFYARHTRAPTTFQSTLPARGATANMVLPLPGNPFQSTLPARGATALILIIL